MSVQKKSLVPIQGRTVQPALLGGISFARYAFRKDSDALFGRSCDFLGDGSVMIYYIPTHSAGSVLILVHDGEDYAVFTGDNSYNRQSWENLNLPGPVYDKGNMRKVLQWIQDMSKDPHCKGIFCAHDPEVKKDVLIF